MKISNRQEQTVDSIIPKVLCKQNMKLENDKLWVSLSTPGDNSRLLEHGQMFYLFLKNIEVIQNFCSTCSKPVENVKVQN